jgi:SAM-dependent methyltransferase
MAAVLLDDSPVSMIGVIPSLADLLNGLPAVEQFFRYGGGRGWGDNGHGLATAQARFSRPMYVHGLVNAWLPAVDGLVARLESGARVMDVGCGYGVSTTLAARQWPASSFVGTDIDPAAVAEAAASAGLSNVSFSAASASSYDGGPVRPDHDSGLPARHG